MSIEDDIEIEEDVPYDASDPKAVNSARKKAARLRKKRLDFVKAMMGMQEGRLWIYDLLIAGHMASPTHTPGDPYSTAFKEGERNFVNRILADINEAAPEQYVKMLKDGVNER